MISMGILCHVVAIGACGPGLIRILCHVVAIGACGPGLIRILCHVVAIGACGPGKSPCSQLCTPHPHSTEHTHQNRTCRCGDEFTFNVTHPGEDETCLCGSNKDEGIVGSFCQRNASKYRIFT